MDNSYSLFPSSIKRPVVPVDNGTTTIVGNGKNDEVQILVVGVMRTGLQTLHEALRLIGYDSIYDQEDIIMTYEHWDDVLQNRSTTDTFHKMFNGYQVVMGMPTFCFWEQILDAYPHARVILTVRDEQEWWQSVQRIHLDMGKDGQGSPLSYGSGMRMLEQFLVPSYHKFCDLLRFAWAATLGAHALEGKVLNEASTRANLRKHNAYVQSVLGSASTVEGHAKLLVYNVRDGWEPLCQFLNMEVPVKEFPSVRTVPFFPGALPDEQPLRVPSSSELEERLLPDSAFGVQMRQEMGRGLFLILLGVTVVVALLVVIHTSNLIWVPLMFVAFVYLALIVVGWNTYVVMYWVVMRVPTLMVLPMAMKSMLIASMLHVVFISYGMLKEFLVTRDGVESQVLVFASRFASVICGAAFLLCSEGRLVFGAPLQDFAAFACTNEISTWAGYEMLNYVSFPVQVMAKSCKMLPTMLMGSIMGVTSYKWHQYLQAVGALFCVAVMHFSEAPGPIHLHNGKPSSANSDRVQNAAIGAFLLVIFFACDSFTSQFQGALYKRNKGLTQTRMMLAGNSVGLIVSTIGLFIRWKSVMQSFTKACNNPEVLLRICALGICGAMGQFCIYYAIRVLGPLSFTWIMTARQLLSVLISLIWFGHGVSVVKIMCILIIFAIMSSRQLAKVMPSVRCCTPRPKRLLRSTANGKKAD